MISILFGTESGNSEMAADDMAAFIVGEGFEAQVCPMEEYDVSAIADESFAIVITSTYGEGELPESTIPFYDAINEGRPDLSSLRFAAFGLGDSNYETYGNGIDVVSGLLRELGATQLGQTGRHDAAKGEALSDVAVNWVKGLLPLVVA